MTKPRRRVVCIYGTRPEAIKMVPLLLAHRQGSRNWSLEAATTGQHPELLRQVHAIFDVEPNYELDLNRNGPELSELFGRACMVVDELLVEICPDVVLVQGDTSSAAAAALAAFHRGIPVGHVEAGLRSHNLASPHPEEGNRKIISAISSMHFAPTRLAKQNLACEGVVENVLVTGNTGIDAVMHVSQTTWHSEDSSASRDILVTAHRRENWGGGISSIASAIRNLCLEFAHFRFTIPMHANPTVQALWQEELGALSQVRLLPPVSYTDLVGLMRSAWLILTDSGGIQEEAPAFGKPVLVLRDTTERPEGVDRGVARLIGTDSTVIATEVKRMNADLDDYQRMSEAQSPYGDGQAAERILDAIPGLWGDAVTVHEFAG